MLSAGDGWAEVHHDEYLMNDTGARPASRRRRPPPPSSTRTGQTDSSASCTAAYATTASTTNAKPGHAANPPRA